MPTGRPLPNSVSQKTSPSSGVLAFKERNPVLLFSVFVLANSLHQLLIRRPFKCESLPYSGKTWQLRSRWSRLHLIRDAFGKKRFDDLNHFFYVVGCSWIHVSWSNVSAFMSSKNAFA
jgi:hypothetical protein